MKKYEKLQLLYILADMNNKFYYNQWCHSSFTIMIIVMNSTLSVHTLELLFILALQLVFVWLQLNAAAKKNQLAMRACLLPPSDLAYFEYFQLYSVDADICPILLLTG